MAGRWGRWRTCVDTTRGFIGGDCHQRSGSVRWHHETRRTSTGYNVAGTGQQRTYRRSFKPVNGYREGCGHGGGIHLWDGACILLCTRPFLGGDSFGIGCRHRACRSCSFPEQATSLAHDALRAAIKAAALIGADLPVYHERLLLPTTRGLADQATSFLIVRKLWRRRGFFFFFFFGEQEAPKTASETLPVGISAAKDPPDFDQRKLADQSGIVTKHSSRFSGFVLPRQAVHRYSRLQLVGSSVSFRFRLRATIQKRGLERTVKLGLNRHRIARSRQLLQGSSALRLSSLPTLSRREGRRPITQFYGAEQFYDDANHSAA